MKVYMCQIHPWLPIINGVHQEDEEIEMVNKVKVDRVKEDTVVENQGEAIKEDEQWEKNNEEEKEFLALYD